MPDNRKRVDSEIQRPEDRSCAEQSPTHPTYESTDLPTGAVLATGAVLVVGAGIGGMQASLDLAEAGLEVYLVDEKPAIGGVMAQLDKTFPTNDCAM